ncbi:MAG: phage tail sheath subtilisin-like domain-containing protein [Anaerolineae bacterium]
MPELVLPGVYIDVRAEALIVPGPVTVGNIGIVGTANRGPVGEVQVLSSYADARAMFGAYDKFDAPDTANSPLTLLRALEIAYSHGAATVFAVRVASNSAAAAKPSSAIAGTNVSLEALSPGSWGNGLTATVGSADAGGNIPLTISLGSQEETFLVKTAQDIVQRIGDARQGSVLVKTTVSGTPTGNVTPTAGGSTPTPLPFTGGKDGADASEADYKAGLELLLNENAHIILAAGQDITEAGADLKAHVEQASTDKIKRDRITVVGSAPAGNDTSAFLSSLLSPTVTGDRVIFVAPGIKTVDAAKAADRTITDPTVTLPGAYTAAAIAGMLSARDPQVSLTNKTLSVSDLEVLFNSGQLEQLVQNGVLGLEVRRGVRVVKGITTDLGAFQQITTRRIVDFAKFGVRSACDPFIGLLNNDRVRQALKGAINGFLAGMVDDEMLESYALDVSATRDQEIRGIAQVTMTLRPTFSIDYIKVTMFLG